MTFRTRVLVACLIVAVLPLALFVLGARRAVGNRLSAQFEQRVAAAKQVVDQDLERHAADVDGLLRALAAELDDNTAQRLALLQRAERGDILDYAARVMRATSLDYLLLLDASGTILSSGHFRNDYDRQLPALTPFLAAPDPVLVAARRPAGAFLALARAHAFTIGTEPFALAGGIEVDSTFMRGLARGDTSELTILLDYPGGSLSSSAHALLRSGYHEQKPLTFIDDAGGGAEAASAQLTIAHSLGALHAIRRGMDVWFIAAMGVAVVLALVIAQLLAARVSRPLEELTRRASRVNLDRADVSFATRRSDEIGALSRMLDTMMQRLRASASQVRAAERRATVGDMARQVNHDIRNGLLPIRNVIQHLAEVAHSAPADLGSVFTERESTLRGGISYLESLATNYARLTPRTERQTCDVNAIIRTALAGSATTARARVELELSSAAPRVSADPVALRRVIENLTVNAIESLANGAGRVTVTTSVAAERVTITVADTGAGIEPEALDHIFDDFYTTKERGTGLGLSIVRRLVADMGGRISVQSERDRGTTFRIELPEANA